MVVRGTGLPCRTHLGLSDCFWLTSTESQGYYTCMYTMPRTKRHAVLPPTRLHGAELEWLKSQANQRNMSLSEYLRLKLLHPGKLRRVSTRRREEHPKEPRKNDWFVPPGETSRTKRGAPNLRCVHGFAVHGNAVPQCLICSSLGLQMPE